ncbi:hypothetical protein LTR05_005761 [Lithohypha guttulata]|uniref:Inhibitor of growth protein N-terminal histone-binding domain-containing protein n=1 Tax=Lithohypha guttulata TaxID=1690604 RepID=A0AAN7SZT1_9EURO|nr:hypothetical protein LTR05_005761 [Lithohypha guttulata]
MAEISEEVAVNPDAQAAVTDFLDYTEYLPTDLIRSLTLIQQLDETYLHHADTVHALTHTYGTLPTIQLSERPDAFGLRSDISRQLDLALNARESAYAEAKRLFDLTDRHQDRLRSIIGKLNALPKPPSRDPTPQPQAPSAGKTSRTGRKLNGSVPRLLLKGPQGTIASSVLPRPRHKRITVPGEVMPPYDPDEPIASTEVSDWESDPPSPVKAPVLKLPKQRPIVEHERKPREHRETSSYRKPTPPPDDAQAGSKWKPWTRLSDYEMYKLRKKMKKNHAWEPSDVMIRRELAEKGRGWDNYYKARAAAQASGTPFLDVDNADKEQVPSILQTEASKSTSKDEPSSRPKPRRTESKKEKKEETPKDPAARAAHEAELAARKLGDIGSTFKNLFSPFSTALQSLKTATGTASPVTTPKIESKPPKKRKIAETASTTPSSEPESQAKKKQKILPKPSPLALPEQATPTLANTNTITIPPIKLKVSVQPSAPAATRPAAPSRSVSTQKPVLAPAPAPAPTPTPVPAKVEATPPPTRPSSRRSAAASIEPSTVHSTRQSRRSSVTPATTAAPLRKTPLLETTPKAVVTAASSRSKREPPGTVTQSSQDGGAAVSVSKRKEKPNKASKAQAPKSTPDAKAQPEPEVRIDIDGNQELLDPGEERYCVCGDVSWGEMICCELDDKCEFGQWFHMDCVSLHDMPPRTVKWFCPGDRKKLHKGESTNGLVGRTIK